MNWAATPPPGGQNPFADEPFPLAPANLNPYASPQPAAPGAFVPKASGFEGLWRQGNALVMHKRASLPFICVKSNQPAQLWLKRDLRWHNPWWALLIFIGLLVYIIVALVTTQRATIHIGLTEEWAQRRKRRILIASLIGLLSVGLGIAAIALGSQGGDMEVFFLLLLPAVVIGLVAVLTGSYGGRLVYPKRITDTHIWLMGVHPDFLNGLPVWPY